MLQSNALEAVVTDAWVSESLILQRRLPEVHPVTQGTGAVQHKVLVMSAGALCVATLDGGYTTVCCGFLGP